MAHGHLFLFAGTHDWLQAPGLLAGSRGNHLDRLFLRLLDFPMASSLALRHIALLHCFEMIELVLEETFPRGADPHVPR